MTTSKLFQDWRRDDLLEEMTKEIGTPDEIQQEVRTHADETERHKTDMAETKRRQATEIQDLHVKHANEREDLERSHRETISSCPRMEEMKRQAESCISDYRTIKADEKYLEEFIKQIPGKKRGSRDLSAIEEKVQKMVEGERKSLQERAADLHAKLTQYWVLLNPKTTTDVSSSATREPAGNSIVNEITALLTADRFPELAALPNLGINGDPLYPNDTPSASTEEDIASGAAEVAGPGNILSNAQTDATRNLWQMPPASQALNYEDLLPKGRFPKGLSAYQSSPEFSTNMAPDFSTDKLSSDSNESDGLQSMSWTDMLNKYLKTGDKKI